MITWVHEGCKHWGWQMRVYYMGKDGWPSRTVLGKMIEEGALGASSSRFVQYAPQFMEERALEFNTAIKSLGESDREILFIDYVVVGKGKTKACRMGISRSTYFNRRDIAHVHLSAAFHNVNLDKIAQISPTQIAVETLQSVRLVAVA